jgi:thermolabile hemolysin
MKHWFAVLILPVLLASNAAQPFEALYAFGDNYTSIVGGPYYQGRWCNGPVWVEQLATKLDLPNQGRNNRAAGTATAQTVLAQVQAFAAGDLESSLSVVFAGAIDFGSSFGSDPTAAGWSNLAEQVLAHSSNAVRTLYGKGARRIVLVNQPDYMRFPQFADLSVADKTFYRSKIIEFNETLGSAAVALEWELPGLQVTLVDAFALFDTVLDQPATYGFTDATASAVHDRRLTNKAFDGPGRNYMFWDPISITSKMHAMLAQWAEAALLGTSLALEQIGEEWVLSAERLLLGKIYALQSSDDASGWTDLQSEQVLFFAGELVFQVPLTRQRQFFRLHYIHR